MWTKLLSSLTFPHLVHLELDTSCPLKMVLEFLKCHATLYRLDLHTCGNPTDYRNIKQYPTISLPFLNHISGPPGYLSALTKHLQNPETVQLLGVTVTDASSAAPFISQVLSTTCHFTDLSCLKITLHLSGCITKVDFKIPDDEKCVCCIRDLKMTHDIWSLGTQLSAPL